MKYFNYLKVGIWILFHFLFVFKSNGQSHNLYAPSLFNFTARILKPDTTPLTAPNVSFTFRVKSTGGCILYEEVYSNVDMTSSFGYVNLSIGGGVPSFTQAGGIKNVFNNMSSTLSCKGGGTYDPSSASSAPQRLLEVNFNDGTGVQVLHDTVISSSPYAILANYSRSADQATNALSLGGILAVNYLQKTQFPAASCNANEFLTYNGTNYICQTASGTGTVFNVATGTGLLGGPITSTGTISVDIGTTSGKIPQIGAGDKIATSIIPNLPASQITSGVLDPARLGSGPAGAGKYLDGTGAWITLPAGNAGTVTSVTSSNSDISVTATTTDPVLTLNSGTGANQIVKLNGSGMLPALDGSLLTGVSGTDSTKLPLAGGTMTGAINMGGYDITGVGHMTMNAQKTLRLGGYTNVQQSALITSFGVPGPANVYHGTTWYNTDTNKMMYWDGSNPQTLGTSTGTVASVSGTSPITVDNTDPTNPVVSLGNLDTTKITSGIFGTSFLGSGTADSTKYLRGDGSWQTLPTTVANFTGNLSGDVSGTQSSTSVDKIKGTALSITSLTSGNFLKYNGTNWVNTNLAAGDIPNLDAAKITTGTLPVANGGTGASTAAGARTNLGLGTAAVVDTGSASGNVPLLGVGGLTANKVCTADGTASGVICTTTMPTSSQWITSANDIYYNIGGVAVGATSVNSTSILDLVSTTKGMLIPRMTTVQRDAITTPATGLQVYNTTTNAINFYDGSGWQALGVAGSGLQSLNGLNATTQTFAIGTSGTAPGFSSASSTHTLNIPMASTAAVTAGLISKTDYDNFNAKLGAVSNLANLNNAKIWVGDASNKSQEVSLNGDITMTNNGTVTVTKIQNRDVSATAPTNGQVLTWNNTSSQWESATPSAAGITALTGDVTASGSGSVAATVASVGGSTAANVHTAEILANAATNTNAASTIVRRDASGNFSAGNITANLIGAASLNVLKAGDTMTGNLVMGGNTAVIFNDNQGVPKSVTLQAPATVTTSYVLKLPLVQGLANQVLTNDGSGNLSWSTSLTNSLASAKILVGNGSNVATAQNPSGDVSMDNAGVFTVTKIQNRTISATAPTNGQVLTWNNTSSQWESATPSAAGITALTGDVTGTGPGSTATTIANSSITSAKILDGTIAPDDLNFAGSMTTNTGLVVRDGSQFYNKTCAGNQALIWSVSNGWICNAVVLSESDPKVSMTTTNAVPKYNGTALVDSVISDSSGQVSVAGNITVNNSAAANVGITVKGASGQTGYLQQFVNFSNTVLAYISSAGDFVLSSGNLVVSAQNATDGAACGTPGAISRDSNGDLFICK